MLGVCTLPQHGHLMCWVSPLCSRQQSPFLSHLLYAITLSTTCVPVSPTRIFSLSLLKTRIMTSVCSLDTSQGCPAGTHWTSWHRGASYISSSPSAATQARNRFILTSFFHPCAYLGTKFYWLCLQNPPKTLEDVSSTPLWLD